MLNDLQQINMIVCNTSKITLSRIFLTLTWRSWQQARLPEVKNKKVKICPLVVSKKYKRANHFISVLKKRPTGNPGKKYITTRKAHCFVIKTSFLPSLSLFKFLFLFFLLATLSFVTPVHTTILFILRHTWGKKCCSKRGK